MFNITPVTKKELTKISDVLEKNNIPYEFEVNNHTMKLKCLTGYYMASDSLIPKHELWFLAWVKQYVYKNEIYKQPNICGDWEKINYLRVKNSTRKTYTKVYEIDLDRAYWETAFDMNIISDAIYFRGLWINKKTRLAAIGQLAKKTDKFKFNGRSTKICPQVICKKTQHLWYNVCYRVGSIMERSARLSAGSVLFYWVDGIYVTNKRSALKISNYFNSIQYDAKIKKMKKLIVSPTVIKVYQNGKKMRKFFISSSKFGQG